MNAQEQLTQIMTRATEPAGEAGQQFTMPPNHVQTLGVKVTDLRKGEKIAEESLFDEKYANPLGLYMGGMTYGLIDAAMGPLSYMVAHGPALTTVFSTTFVQPFSKKDEKVVVEAVIIVKSKRLVILEETAKTAAGKLVAKAGSTPMIAG